MPTDVLCNIIEDHQLLNHHQPSSDSALITNNLSKSESSQQTSNGLLKNMRSASLPLKILLNENGSCRSNRHKRLPVNNYRLSSTMADINEKLIRSWSGMDTFLTNQLSKNDSTNNNNNETNFILYARFSLSEHFLNLIGEDQVANENFHREERNESPLSNNDSIKQNTHTTTENYYEDDEEVMSSSPLLSESSTIGGEDVVQFVLDTEDEPNPASHSTIISGNSPTSDSEYSLSSDINNNDDCFDDQDDDKCSDKIDDDQEAVVVNNELEIRTSVDKCLSFDHEKVSKSDMNDKPGHEYSVLNSNDLDQTITYEHLNEVDSTSIISNTSDNYTENLIDSVNKVNIHEKTSNSSSTNQSQESSAVVQPIVPCLSTFHNTSNNSNDKLNSQELDSNLTHSFNNNSSANSDCETSGFNSSISSLTHNESITTPTTDSISVSTNPKADETKEKNISSSPLSWSLVSSSASILNTSTITDEDEDDIFKNFMPKKSCLKKNRQQLYIDTSTSSSAGSSYPTENATSSPLVPATPTSPMSSSISSSPLFSSSSSSFQSPPNSSATSSEISRSKKRVSFADVCGKDLFTIRTMSEPSNCPPKLTSKIVQFFLNREFNQQQQQPSIKSCYGGRTGLNDYMYPNGSDFFSRARNYGYGISTSNYTNDLNQLAGTIAVYSLNFAQPAADYFKFRSKISEQSVSLENVLLNRFQINGTIKVKNSHFHKHVFVRCSFDKWTSHQDYSAHYVPYEYYSSGESMMSTSNTLLSSPTSHSVSATFYSSGGLHHHGSASGFQSHHKEFDTFRFEFELPKSPSDPPTINKNSPNASIQFCICYRTGDSIEYWDNNDGKNYEILQYVIDIESLKPQSKSPIAESSKSRNFKYEGANSRTPTNLLTPSTESSNDVYY